MKKVDLFLNVGVRKEPFVDNSIQDKRVEYPNLIITTTGKRKTKEREDAFVDRSNRKILKEMCKGALRLRRHRTPTAMSMAMLTGLLTLKQSFALDTHVDSCLCRTVELKVLTFGGYHAMIDRTDITESSQKC